LNPARGSAPGKAKLLENIRDTGSISAAAREMGMSYKRTRLLLDSINQATELIVTAAPGGAGATLTPFGAEAKAIGRGWRSRGSEVTTGPKQPM
jgi:molybdate transport system regulatory protein